MWDYIIGMKTKIDISEGAKAFAQRMENAERRALDFIKSNGFSEKESKIIFSVMRKEKVLKLDLILGQFTFSHGVFAEKWVMKNALEMGNSVEQKVSVSKKKFNGVRK